jgi:hypothetical protein
VIDLVVLTSQSADLPDIKFLSLLTGTDSSSQYLCTILLHLLLHVYLICLGGSVFYYPDAVNAALPQDLYRHFNHPQVIVSQLIVTVSSTCTFIM